MNKEELLKSQMNPSLPASLALFNEACTDMLSAKYILAGRKISRVLYSIASSQPLCDFFARQTQGYRFLSEFEAAKYRDEHGRPYLRVPADPTAQVCFTFCLLFAVDSGKLELKNLLQTFYADGGGANEEFSRFCRELIEPFLHNVNALLMEPIPTTEEVYPPEDPETAVPLPDEPPPQPVDEPIGDQPDALALGSLKQLTAEIIGLVARDPSVSDNEREELLLIADAYAEALGYGQTKTIRIMYIALKNSLRCSSLYHSLSTQYQNLKSLMFEYMLA